MELPTDIEYERKYVKSEIDKVGVQDIEGETMLASFIKLGPVIEEWEWVRMFWFVLLCRRR